MVSSPARVRTRHLQAALALALAAVLILPTGPASAAGAPSAQPTDAAAPSPIEPPPVEPGGALPGPSPLPEPTSSVPPVDSASGEPGAGQPAPVEPSPSEPAQPAPEEPAPEEPSPDEPAPEEPAPEAPVAPGAEMDALLAPAKTAATLPAASRISGPNAVGQAVAISRALYPRGADAVVISAASGSDSQIAAFVAGSVGAPLLFVGASSIPADTARELTRLSPARIVLVGSTAAVAEKVRTALSRTAPAERISGRNAYALSQNALRAVGPAPRVYIADGASMAYAPVALGVASARGQGFLAVNGPSGAASSGTVSALRDVGAKEIVLVGGSSSVGAPFTASLRRLGFTVRRITGANPASVSRFAAAEYPAGSTRAVVASAVAPGVVTAPAAAAAGLTRQPFFLTRYECVYDTIAAEIDRRNDRPLVIGATTVLSAAVVAGDGCSAVKRAGQTALARALQSAFGRHPSSSYTVTVRQIGGLEQVASSGGATRREPASMMKLFVAWASFERIERGQASLKTKLSSGLTVEQCLRELIWMSDNYCHTDLVHWIGLSALNREIAAAGFSRTAYGSVLRGQDVLYGGNRTTTNDLSLLLKRLDAGKLLNATHTAHLKRLMHAQLFRSRIPNGLPASAYQASKPGSLWVSGGLLQADSAIVAGKKGRYVISVIGDAGSTKAGIRDISRAVYSHFNGSFGAAITHSDLHVRTKAATPWRRSPGGAIVGSIPSGTPLQVSDSRRHWYKVHYRGGYAWIWYTTVRSNLS